MVNSVDSEEISGYNEFADWKFPRHLASKGKGDLTDKQPRSWESATKRARLAEPRFDI